MSQSTTSSDAPVTVKRNRPKVASDIVWVSFTNLSKTAPDWYKIPEINISIFIDLLKGIYEVLEEKNKPKSEEDVFARECWSSYYDITKEAVDEERKRVQKEKAFTMKLGDFHQDLMGSFSGWENYKKGHETGCDVGKIDGTCIAEIKNNKNTMNNTTITTNTKKQRSKPIRLSNSDKLMKRILKYEAIHALEDIVNDNLYKGQVKYKSKYIIESPMLTPKCIACQYIKCFCSYKTTE